MIKNKRKNNREWTPTPKVQVFSARKTVGSETIIRHKRRKICTNYFDEQ